MEGPRKRWLLAAFAVALVVRVGAIALARGDVARFGDAQDYLATASHLCQEHEYPDRGSLPFFRAPLLPFFIAATTHCHPERLIVIKVALAACDSATVLVVGEIAWLLFGSSGAAMAAALIAAFDPFFIASVVDIRTEPLFMLFLTLGIWFFLRARDDGRKLCALASGAAFALAALTRPAGLLAGAFAGVTLLFSRGFRKPRWAKAGALLAGAAIVLSPWIARNALRFHELILVNDAAGFSFWRGSHPEIDRISRIRDPAEYRRAAEAFETDLTPAAAVTIARSNRSPVEQSRAWFAEGLANISRDPAEAATFAVRKAWWFWRPWLGPREHGKMAVLGSGALNLLLYAFVAIGLARHWKRDPFVVAWVLGYFLVVWLAHIPHQVVMRFRIPFTDPLIIAFAASAMIQAVETPRPTLLSAT